MNRLPNLIYLLILLFCLFSCQSPTDKTTTATTEVTTSAVDEAGFVSTLEKHLRAVSERDLVTLKSTLSPSGDMLLILPQTPLSTQVTEFMEFHEAWFQDTTWTFETKIVTTDVQPQMGIAVVESLYREPERDGKPYFNRMHISYALRKINNQWYVVKDHACSLEKSTDEG